MSAGKPKKSVDLDAHEKVKKPGWLQDLLHFDPVNFISDMWDALDMWRGTRRWGPIMLMIPGMLLLTALVLVFGYGAVFGEDAVRRNYTAKSTEVDPLKDGFGTKKDAKKPGDGGISSDLSADDELAERMTEAQKKAKEEQDYRDALFADLLNRRVLQLQPDNKAAKYRVAARIGERGNTEQARNMMSTLAPADSVGYPYAHAWLAYDLYSRFLMREKIEPVAFKNAFFHHVTAASEARIDAPVWARVLALYAQFLLGDKNEKDHGEAINVLQRAAAIEPALLLQLSKVYKSQDQKIQARDAANTAAARFSERLGGRDELDTDRIMVASAHLENGMFDEAIKVLQEGFRIRADRPRLRRALSDVYRMMFRAQVVKADNGYKANLGLLNMALTIDPTNPAVGEEIMWLQNLGVTVNESMIELLRVQLAQGSISPVTHLLLGNAYFNQKSMKKAVTHWELALKNDPDMVLALNNLSVANSQLEAPQFDQAIQLIDRAIELSDGAPEFLDSKGEILFRAGKYIESIAAYEKALQKAPMRLGTREKLIESYRKAGMTEMVDAQLTAVEKIRDELKARGLIPYGNTVLPIRTPEESKEGTAAPTDEKAKPEEKPKDEPRTDMEKFIEDLNKK
jgi:tetratricopeptide (TPR) repeat protein